MKKKLIEIAPPVKAINRASAQEEIRVICYPPAPLDTEDPGRIWEFAFKYNAYEKLGSFQAVCKLAHEREKVFMDTGKWIGTVDELRACLFFEQRRWRHMGEDPEGESLHRLIHLYRTICDRWSEVELEASVSHGPLEDGV